MTRYLPLAYSLIFASIFTCWWLIWCYPTARMVFALVAVTVFFELQKDAEAA